MFWNELLLVFMLAPPISSSVHSLGGDGVGPFTEAGSRGDALAGAGAGVVGKGAPQRMRAANPRRQETRPMAGRTSTEEHGVRADPRRRCRDRGANGGSVYHRRVGGQFARKW